MRLRQVTELEKGNVLKRNVEEEEKKNINSSD